MMYFVYSFSRSGAVPTEIYTLSLHDALPIFRPLDHAEIHRSRRCACDHARSLDRSSAEPQISGQFARPYASSHSLGDRKSTRLNSSHGYISYAVFCLKKKISRLGVKFKE